MNIWYNYEAQGALIGFFIFLLLSIYYSYQKWKSKKEKLVTPDKK